ncbi:AAA family ATPase [Polyangium jinanense]|uniref:AAA family ATPase n=1 Tax=Polyangium mundeleinium TaxID=2995306 RepID=A0ABT5EJF7_9BACT|nr:MULTISPECIES: AAA family ATPase [Polyangium]MDC0740890.1 AAA family ATPase [Polyangium mundeleinium]MDC3956243.1 AAA family ATPase [Polyangium jinanense]
MQLFKLTIKGFRCFGPEETTIEFDPLTAFVGANGAGKSAALIALVRMFGTTNAHRTLTREDFHVSSAAGASMPNQLDLRIEAWFQFPELLNDAAAAASAAVPECLKHIVVSETASVPMCRIRLDGSWSAGPTAEGEVEQRLSWVNSDAVDAPEEKVFPLSGVERRLIQALYIPATRDAVRELRAVSGTILSRVLKVIRWPDELKEKISKLDRELTGMVRAEATLSELESTLREHWSDLVSGTSVPSFTFADTDLAGVLRRLDAEISGPVGSRSIHLLSEGERSLLYFALVESTLTFEAKLAGKGSATFDSGPRPVLTLLAVEEPENHLAPQYLGRILKKLRNLIAAGGVQVLLTSHSASIMRRVEPSEVRHFRAEANGGRRITRLSLPKDTEEAFKYVREAVMAYPELYFASVVVLGEGASEEIVIPRVARVLGLDIDPRFIAVVPLGGRHVHHFWRLLREIGTPYVTLTDLDLERHGGGWARIRDLVGELVEFGEGSAKVLDGVHLEQVDTVVPVAITDPTFASWIRHLEVGFNVFMSAPLDLDFSMLSAFPEAYKKLAPSRGGPQFPQPHEDVKPFVERVTRATLGTNGGSGLTYTDEEHKLFSWYAYFFASGSKPATHARALAQCDDTTLAKGAPDVLRRLAERVKALAPT